MTLRKRLARLEADRSGSNDEREPVLLAIAGKTDADVIGIGTTRANTVARLPGESLDGLVRRARPLLARPWTIGLPHILCCAYAEEGEAA